MNKEIKASDTNARTSEKIPYRGLETFCSGYIKFRQQLDKKLGIDKFSETVQGEGYFSKWLDTFIKATSKDDLHEVYSDSKELQATIEDEVKQRKNSEKTINDK